MSTPNNISNEQTLAEASVFGKLFCLSGINLNNFSPSISDSQNQHNCKSITNLNEDSVFDENGHFLKDSFKDGRYFKLTSSFPDTNNLDILDYNKLNDHNQDDNCVDSYNEYNGNQIEKKCQFSAGTWFVFAGYSEKSDDINSTRIYENFNSSVVYNQEEINISAKSIVHENEIFIKTTNDNVKLDFEVLEEDIKIITFYENNTSQNNFKSRLQGIQEHELFPEKKFDNIEISFHELESNNKNESLLKFLDKVNNNAVDNSLNEVEKSSIGTICTKNAIPVTFNQSTIILTNKFEEVSLTINTEQLGVHLEDSESTTLILNKPPVSPRSKVIIRQKDLIDKPSATSNSNDYKEKCRKVSDEYFEEVFLKLNMLDLDINLDDSQNRSNVFENEPLTSSRSKIFIRQTDSFNKSPIKIEKQRKVSDENIHELFQEANMKEIDFNFPDSDNNLNTQKNDTSDSDHSYKNESFGSPRSSVFIKSKKMLDKSFSTDLSAGKFIIKDQSSDRKSMSMSKLIKKSNSVLKKGVSKSLDYSSSEDENNKSLKRSRSFRRSIVIQDEEGEIIKNQSGVFVSINFITPLAQFNKENSKDMNIDTHQRLRSLLLFLENMVVSVATFAEYFEAVKQLHSIFSELNGDIHKGYSVKTKDDCSSMLNYLVYSDWPKVILSCMRKLVASYPNVFTEYECIEKVVYYGGNMPSALRMNRTTPEFAVSVIFDGLLKAAINFTSLHEPSRLSCCEDKLVHFLVADVLPKLKNIIWGKSTARESFLNSTCKLLYNCAQSRNCIPIFINDGCVSILSDMQHATIGIQGAQKPGITILMILSFMVDQSHEVFDEASVIWLLQCLDKSLEDSKHMIHDFNACDLANCFTRIASNEVIRERIVQNSGQEIFHKFLRHSYNDNEQIAACNSLWSIAFNSQAKDIIRGMGKLMNLLLKLKESDNDDLCCAASGVIWECVEKYELNGNKESVSSFDYVVISYEFDAESLALDIKEELQCNGFVVWTKNSKDDISFLEAMSEIQCSSIFIALVSRVYKESPRAFSELELAHTLRKPIVPLLLERNFCPDGWLGDVIKKTKPIDFSIGSSHSVRFELLVDLIKSSLGQSTLNEKVNTGEENGFERNQDVTKWSNKDVVDWLKENNLIKFTNVSKRLLKINGLHLLMFYDLKKQSPDYYYSVLDFRLGLKDILDTLEFTYALDRLLGNERLI
ncbi:uncharacterized protein LOC101237114 [Hydra vulgaris]|uniref:uncharacterized protein LOC101237114 n=1 Tax=Hydra vulgaris TaxID=6087 RepID=UPI001F5E86C5|nr:uncharacterized protein LOC101237114 [Hydra vulgaris]XP_012553818.2 uncharacterized protein LOC101237114 [Hydra vulgaris]XP_012553819.2 uncharacterized protein LOC101237114 [Hydra vulgaris]